MTKIKKISIIVPVYNVEKYLDQCITSIINQSMKELEIILVNDGSTDNSLQICNKYKALDERIMVLDKKNGGLSDARNYGLKYANAEFIGFVDSDDYIDSKFYERLYEGLQNDGVYVAVSCIKRINDFEDILYTSQHQAEGIITNYEAMKSMLTAKGISNSVCNKLFCIKLFDEKPFPVGKLYEDEFVTYKIVDKSPKVFISNSTSYYYRANKNGITRRTFTEKELDRIEASLIRLDYLNNKYNTLVEDGIRYLMYDCLTTLSKMDKYDHKYDKIILNNIRSSLHIYMKGNSSFGAKGFALFSAISPKFSIFIFKFIFKELMEKI